MVIIESTIFTRLVKKLMKEDDYRQLQQFLILRPNSGSLIKDSGGLRKLRWSLDSRGKSSGLRIIYYWMVAKNHLYMVYLYPKNKQENLTSQQLSVLKSIVERWSDE